MVGSSDAQQRSIRVAKMLSHPLRVRILMAMNAPARPMSPKQFSDETGEKLGDCSYHFRELEKAGCLEVVETHKRRGATEHVFAPVKRAMAWTREWESLGPVVRQNLAATALRGVVEAIGTAIDGGTFDARDDSHLSFDTQDVDEQGWHELHRSLQVALEEALTITHRAGERLAANPELERFPATYMLAAFENAPRAG